MYMMYVYNIYIYDVCVCVCILSSATPHPHFCLTAFLLHTRSPSFLSARPWAPSIQRVPREHPLPRHGTLLSTPLP